MLKSTLVAIAAGAISFSLIAVAPRSAATTSLLAPQQTALSATQPGQGAPPNMAEMMKRHQQMMAEMKAADEELDQLMTQMNAATGDAKVAAMAQVVNELVRQQKVMHEHVAQMPMMGGRGMMNR
jgi:hypothetical protein